MDALAKYKTIFSSEPFNSISCVCLPRSIGLCVVGILRSIWAEQNDCCWWWWLWRMLVVGINPTFMKFWVHHQSYCCNSNWFRWNWYYLPSNILGREDTRNFWQIHNQTKEAKEKNPKPQSRSQSCSLPNPKWALTPPRFRTRNRPDFLNAQFSMKPKSESNTQVLSNGLIVPRGWGKKETEKTIRKKSG